MHLLADWTGLARWGLLVALFVAPVSPHGDPFEWQAATPESQGFSAQSLDSLREDLVARKTTSLLVIRNDKIVLEWYAPGSTQKTRRPTASLAKALVGGLSLAVASNEGLLSPDDMARVYIPAWRDDPRKSAITLLQLATHSSGLEDAEEGGRPHDRLDGWKGDFWKRRPPPDDSFTLSRDRAPLIAAPGAEFHYSNPGMAMLAYAVTASLRNFPEKDLRSLLRERVMKPIGIDDSEWSAGYGETVTVDGLQLVANWGGATFTPRATARIGRLFLRKGEWEGRPVLKAKSVALAVGPAPSPLPKAERARGNPFPASGLGWYTNAESVWPEAPRDLFAGAGAGHQVLLVIPSLNLILVRNGSSLGGQFWEGVRNHLVRPLIESVLDSPLVSSYPAPPSPVIRHILWTPFGEITRRAPDGDSWPLTWGEDDALYTGYGDGTGFEPKVEKKLSLGFAKVEGPGSEFAGTNIRSATGEDTGDGRRGRKLSGLLMVDNVIYAWFRNADRKGAECQLGWSKDHEVTWSYSDWKFEELGYITFMNYGPNYAGARDDFVYLYSHDHPSAYRAADRMILARVPRDKIRERNAYEFLKSLDSEGRPAWTPDIRERGAVFSHPGKCLRSAVTFDAGLRRYLWWQQVPAGPSEPDTRFSGGFGIYDAPEPWGPWTTAYFTEKWDTGPGETASFPTKWMSQDGKHLYLVFSGNDSFSVRAAEIMADPR